MHAIYIYIYIHMCMYTCIYISMYGHHWSAEVRSITRSTAHGSAGAKSSECRGRRNDQRITMRGEIEWPRTQLVGRLVLADWWFQPVEKHTVEYCVCIYIVISAHINTYEALDICIYVYDM